MIETGLHDDKIYFRKLCNFRNVAVNHCQAFSSACSDEFVVNVDTDITHSLVLQVAGVEHSRAAAHVKDASSRRNQFCNRTISRCVALPIEQQHEQLISRLVVIDNMAHTRYSSKDTVSTTAACGFR